MKVNINFGKLSFGEKVIWVLAGFGIILIGYRFIFGLGAATNLSDGYPWGLWIGFDVLTGIALAAGGFVMAGTVHLFGGHKYHPLVKPAILTALLGYLLFAFALLFDLGRPWNLWRAIHAWHHESPMFEVAWCVMFYTTVLILEFLPVIFEKYKLDKLHALWDKFVPWVIIFMLSIFILAMTYSFVWMIILAIILLGWEFSMRLGWMPRDKQMPIILVMSGIMFSTMHQSALGTVFLLASTKLHPLWYTPINPLLFLSSAIMVGPAMVIFESLMTEKYVGHKARFDLLQNLAKVMPYLLMGYLVLKIGDVLVRGVVLEAFSFNAQSISWWLEISIGIVLPLILFLTPEYMKTKSGVLWSSLFVVIGIVWNRINVSVVGIKVDAWESYYPFWAEIFITLGVISIGLIVFKWAVENLPIYEHETVSLN